MFKTELEFKQSELNKKDWYFETYPFLKEFEFPIKFSDLQNFYLVDMNSRNLTPLENFVNVYEFVFSYFLENYPRLEDGTRFRGKTFIQRFPENLDSALSTTFKPFKNIAEAGFNILEAIGNISKNFWFLFIPVIGFLIYKKFIK
jgi:hypothetical protein